MKIKQNIIKGMHWKSISKDFKYIVIPCLVLLLMACESFVEIDPPKDSLVSETVFEDAKTVESALGNIYVKIRQGGLVSGYFGLGVSMGIYTDELDYFGSSSDILKLYGHNVLASDGTVSTWWSHAYNIIYAANEIIEGVDGSNALGAADKDRFTGQALFVRVYMHSLLASLFGDVPYITTTDYIDNNQVVREPIQTVYEAMIGDLTEAVELLDDIDASGEHIIPTKSVANALLSRLYLYSDDWSMAEVTATKLIADNMLEDIDKVFLKGSKETIWQLKLGDNPINTYEALQLIIPFIPTQGMALTDDLKDAFEADDLREAHWTSSITSGDGLTTLHYAHKYRATHNTTTLPEEYPIVFRLAEQYLIRAEARANMGDIIGAQDDINAIRNRAGLGDTMANNKATLLEAVLQERRVELFTEQGHRWFDLIRLERASAVLTPIKVGWRETDILFPLPDSELELNPNLSPQNSGY